MSAACFHCGLAIPEAVELFAVVDGVRRAMCCPGCVAVAELIGGSGLGAYYRYRAEPGARPTDAVAEELAVFDHEALQRGFVRRLDDGSSSVTLSIEGMRCAACVWLLEKHLGQCAGVVSVAVNLGAGRAELRWKAEATRLSTLLAEVARLGYAARPYRPDWQEEVRRDEFRGALRRLVVAGLGAMQAMMYAVGLYAGALEGIAEEHRLLLRVSSGVVATPVLLYSARPFFAGAWRDLAARRLGMDVPVALALAIAWTASVWATWTGGGEVYFDSVSMFVFFLTVGRFVEMRARQDAAAAVEGALRRPPETATLLLEGGATRIVPVHELAPGDRVLVRPGEAFPADGRIVEGRGWVNEAMLTGEHWPRERGVGDDVAGGTANGESPLVVEATRTGAETAWASIVRLVDEAGRERPAIARLADRVARVFVPAVLVVSAATALAWWQVDSGRAFWVALSVLVVTCPCALALATPAALTAAAGGALRRGLLLRSGVALETLQKVTHVVFDKTGTLTMGTFRRAAVRTTGRMGEAEALAAAAALERFSEHPLARAFDDVDCGAVAVTDVSATAGAGVEGVVGGVRLRVGAPRWVAGLAARDAGYAIGPAGAGVEGLPDDSAMALGDCHGILATFQMEDRLRPDAAATVARLRARGLAVSLVSGDAPAAVAAVARAVGIDDAHSRATPAGKLAFVRALAERGEVVLMVGDGVNDAPVLQAAHVSIAMGGGTDLARARADAVLLTESLSAVVEALELAARTRRTMRQNLAWSLVYNLLALPLATAGLVTPWMAALGMSASSLVVVLNAVRLGKGVGRGVGASASSGAAADGSALGVSALRDAGVAAADGGAGVTWVRGRAVGRGGAALGGRPTARTLDGAAGAPA